MARKRKKRRNYNGRTVTWIRAPGEDPIEDSAVLLEGIVIKTILEVQRTDGRIVRVDARRVRVVG